MGFNPLASDCWAEFFRDRFGQEPPPLPSELEDTISSDEYSNISGTISVANGGTGTHKKKKPAKIKLSDGRSFERFQDHVEEVLEFAYPQYLGGEYTEDDDCYYYTKLDPLLHIIDVPPDGLVITKTRTKHARCYGVWGAVHMLLRPDSEYAIDIDLY